MTNTINIKKIFQIAVIVFLLMALPVALLLSRQRQEIRKKAAGSTANLVFTNEAPSVGTPVTATLKFTNTSDQFVYAYGKIVLPNTVTITNTLYNSSATFAPLDGVKTSGNTVELYGGAKIINSPFSGNFLSVTFTPNTGVSGTQNVQYQLIGVKRDGSTFTTGAQLLSTSFTVQGASEATATAIATATATATPTATPTVTLAPNAAVIILGTPTRIGNNLSFPINYEAGANPSTIGLSVHYDTSKLTYVSADKGGSFNKLQFYGTDGAGSDRKLNFGVSEFIASSASKHAATVTFTLNSGVQSASIWLIKTELSVAGFTNIDCTPISGNSCTQTYSPTTPTPTATAVVTPTPTATPTVTPTPTPTAAPGGATEPVNSITVGAVQAYTEAGVTKYKVPVTVRGNPRSTLAFGGDSPQPLCAVKLVGGPADIFSQAATNTDLKAVFTAPQSNTFPEDQRFKGHCVTNTDANGEATFDFVFNPAAYGTMRRLYAIFHNDAVNKSSNYFTNLSWSMPVYSVPIDLTSIAPVVTPTPTIPAGGVPGDTNGNGCVGIRDLGYVAGHVQTTTQCTPPRTPMPNPGPASNGDFNNDGCVDDRDYSLVVELARLSCVE